MIQTNTPRYTRVKICPNPRCKINGGKKGTLDLHGKMVGYTEPVAMVLVDGGGACGPYRYDELTPLSERDLETIDAGNERHGPVYRDKTTGERLAGCYGCGRPSDEHPLEADQRGGVRRGKCPPMRIDGPVFESDKPLSLTGAEAASLRVLLEYSTPAERRSFEEECDADPRREVGHIYHHIHKLRAAMGLTND